MVVWKGDLENFGNVFVVVIYRLMMLEVIIVRMGNEIIWNMFFWCFLCYVLNYVFW